MSTNVSMYVMGHTPPEIGNNASSNFPCILDYFPHLGLSTLHRNIIDLATEYDRFLRWRDDLPKVEGLSRYQVINNERLLESIELDEGVYIIWEGLSGARELREKLEPYLEHYWWFHVTF